MNKLVREKTPLVHVMTNYVTVNDVANAILAIGASPIMADDISEVEEITSISSALVINIGTLNKRTIESMIKAGIKANEKNIPVVLDPVGAGASTLRNNTIKELLEKVKFSVIKGNMAEISFLTGLDIESRGVDSDIEYTEESGVALALKANKMFDAVIAITGKLDIVTDGKRVEHIKNGVSMLKKVTGTGCMTAGLIGSYVGAMDDYFTATVEAIRSMGIAGEVSYDLNYTNGTGSFHIGIIDALSKIDDEILKKRAL